MDVLPGVITYRYGMYTNFTIVERGKTNIIFTARNQAEAWLDVAQRELSSGANWQSLC